MKKDPYQPKLQGSRKLLSIDIFVSSDHKLNSFAVFTYLYMLYYF